MTTEVLSLEVKGLAASYGVVPALRDVGLQVRRGQVVTIVGANGAGKSTLMKCVSGLLRPAAGEVRLFGEALRERGADERVARGLALVPEGRRLFGPMTVGANLQLGAYARRDKAAVAASMARVLALFPDLRGRLDAKAATLSGGQQQMVAVGRALMSAPRMLLLDEPTIGLAPAVVAQIGRAVREVCKEGVDVLLVEQNAEMALSIADYAYVLERGSVVMHGHATELAGNREVQRAYMGL